MCVVNANSFAICFVLVKAADTIANLPLECQYVNKTALQSLVGNLPPVKRHFSLLKRPKSAALRTELLHKCKLPINL